MAFAGNTLELIRTVFRRSTALPIGPSYFDSIQNNAMGYSNVALGPQNGYNTYLTDSVRIDQDLMSRYADAEDMDEYPILGSALDLYADDATVQDVLSGRSLWFESADPTIEGILEDMLTVNLRAEEHLWEIVRSLCKYGSNFEELLVVDGRGVIKLNHLPPPSVRRIEDINGILYGYLQDPAMTFQMDTSTFMTRLNEKSAGVISPLMQDGTNYNDLLQVFEPWEVVHFRLKGKTRKDLYGVSILEPARWVWKRLTMMEDAMLLYKLTRSAQRYAYYVDVGDVPPNQARQFVNKIKNDFKKTKFIDPVSGKPSFRFNPLSNDEDLFIPVRKGKKSTEVEVLSGPEGQQVDDVNYFNEKIFAALKIPKSYLGGDDTVGRNNLCLVPETKIPLVDGRIVDLAQMIEEHNAGKQNWVYSYKVSTDDLKPGKVVAAMWTRKDAKVVRVHLDNGSFIDATPDHRFLLRDGSYREAGSLEAGIALRSCELPVAGIHDMILCYQFKVDRVEKLTVRRDCCDIEIEEYHNFATQAGVFVHNSQQDVRFARTVMRIQRETKNGFNQIARVDLSARNIDPDKIQFESKMVIPSGVFELAQMEVQNAKLDLADKFRSANFSEYYIWSNILSLTDEEISTIQKQRAQESESNLSAEEAGQIRDIMPQAVDRAGATVDKKAVELTSQILDEVQQGNSKFAKKIQELKLLTTEIRQAVQNQKYYRGRR